MSLLENCSIKLTSIINEYYNKTGVELEKLKYGIDVLLINISKLTIIFIFAAILNIFKITFIFFLSFSLVRIFAFGLHASTSLNCTISTTTVFIGGGLISKYVYINKYILIIIFFINIVLLALYAPADTEKRPIISEKLRKKLKHKSIINTSILFILSLIINNEIYRTAITLGVLCECILTTPFLYKVLGKEYRNYEKFNK